MKRKFSFVLALVLCFSLVTASPAKAVTTTTTESTEMVEVPVFDTNGNQIGTVEMYSLTSILIGASILWGKVKIAVYTVSGWVLTHPEYIQLIDMLSTLFIDVQIEVGEPLISATYDGEEYTSVETESGNQCVSVGGGRWACRYSV